MKLIPKIALVVVLSFFVLSLKPQAEASSDRLLFAGVDRGDPRFVCRISIEESHYVDQIKTSENLRAWVQTNYAHGDAQAPRLLVSRTGISPDGTQTIYQGSDSAGNIVRVAIPAGDITFERPSQVNVRWFHIDHFHTNTCLRLRPVTQR
jgi:hypothetical protein